ncbi:MAG: ferritin-like domain-containing protein [Cytophagaceae bacterium]
MDLKAIERIYILQLKQIYSAENQMIAVLPKVIRVIQHKELKAAIKDHLEQTRNQATRIQALFRDLGNYKPHGENCDVVEGLLDELEDLIDDSHHTDTLDAEIILLFQKIEHYEIACYASMVTYARVLGQEAASEMLQESLDEEYEADNKLDKLNEEVVSGMLLKHA